MASQSAELNAFLTSNVMIAQYPLSPSSQRLPLIASFVVFGNQIGEPTSRFLTGVPLISYKFFFPKVSGRINHKEWKAYCLLLSLGKIDSLRPTKHSLLNKSIKNLTNSAVLLPIEYILRPPSNVFLNFANDNT